MQAPRVGPEMVKAPTGFGSLVKMALSVYLRSMWKRREGMFGAARLVVDVYIDLLDVFGEGHLEPIK